MGETSRTAMSNAKCAMRNEKNLSLVPCPLSLKEEAQRGVTFRALTFDDANALAVLDKKCFGKHDAWHRGYFLYAAANPNAEYLIAELDGKIVACAGAEIDSDAAEIETVGVDPDYQRLGIGTKLFANLLAAVKVRGASVVYLEVRPSNTPAINLYQKFGFRLVSRIEDFYHDEDALIMLRTL